MSEFNIELDFEDLIQLYTPGSIDRNVLTLDAAWQLLKRKYPNNEFITSEVKAWDLWAKEILDSSWFYKTLPTGIMEELDDWKARYNAAYLSSPNKDNLVKPTTIGADDSIFKKPAFWAAIGILTAAGIFIYARTKR